METDNTHQTDTPVEAPLFGYEGPHEDVIKILGRMTAFAADRLKRPPKEARDALNSYLEDTGINSDETTGILDVIPAIADATTEMARDRRHIQLGLYYWLGCSAVDTEGQTELVAGTRERLQQLGGEGRRLSWKLS